MSETFTKTHFDLIAGVLRREVEQHGESAVTRRLTQDFAAALEKAKTRRSHPDPARDVPGVPRPRRQFNPARFRAAAGYASTWPSTERGIELAQQMNEWLAAPDATQTPFVVGCDGLNEAYGLHYVVSELVEWCRAARDELAALAAGVSS